MGCLRGDLKDFVNSLQRIKSLEIDRAFLSHDGIIKNAHERIDEILEQKLEEREKLLEILEKGEKDISQLVTTIYPKGGFPYFTYHPRSSHRASKRRKNKDAKGKSGEVYR